MLKTYTPGDRVSAAEDVCAAFSVALLNMKRTRRQSRAAHAAERAQRRADRAVRIALRTPSRAAQPPRA